MGMIWNWGGGGGGAPSGNAGGDLAGTYPNPQLANNATARGDLGLGSVSTHALTDLLQVLNNLSDLGNAGTARGNLGLGTIATHPTGDFYASTVTLDAIALAIAALNMNNNKISGLANGTLATDAAAFGQIPAALPPNGGAGGDLAGTYPNPTVNSTANFKTQVETVRLDQMAAPTAAVAANNQKITGLANGTAATDAAAFGQVPIYLPSGLGAGVATSQASSSTTYTDLATVGPQVSITTKTTALVFMACSMLNNTAGQAAWMSFGVSGATTIAAADGTSLELISNTASQLAQVGSFAYVSGLTGGINVFTSKFRVAANTGTWASRFLAVIPLPV